MLLQIFLHIPALGTKHPPPSAARRRRRGAPLFVHGASGCQPAAASPPRTPPRVPVRHNMGHRPSGDRHDDRVRAQRHRARRGVGRRLLRLRGVRAHLGGEQQRLQRCPQQLRRRQVQLLRRKQREVLEPVPDDDGERGKRRSRVERRVQLLLLLLDGRRFRGPGASLATVPGSQTKTAPVTRARAPSRRDAPLATKASHAPRRD